MKRMTSKQIAAAGSMMALVFIALAERHRCTVGYVVMQIANGNKRFNHEFDELRKLAEKTDKRVIEVSK